MSEKHRRETETAITFAMVLLKILIAAIVGATIWVLQSAITEPSSLYTILRSDIMPLIK